jgi:hypothetical protein
MKWLKHGRLRITHTGPNHADNGILFRSRRQPRRGNFHVTDRHKTHRFGPLEKPP